MKNFVCYKLNGEVTKYGSCQDETFQYQASDDDEILEAIYTGNQYVKDGELIDMPNKPSGDWVFDYNSYQWILDIELTTSRALSQRDELLKNGPDRISPLWWSSMSIEQQNAWSQYRQDLLDITSQPEFPNVIIWPTKPTEGA